MGVCWPRGMCIGSLAERCRYVDMQLGFLFRYVYTYIHT